MRFKVPLLKAPPSPPLEKFAKQSPIQTIHGFINTVKYWSHTLDHAPWWRWSSGVEFQKINTFYCFFKDILKVKLLGLWLLLVQFGTSADMCQFTSSSALHCFCIIGTNIKTVKKLNNFFTLIWEVWTSWTSWKRLWPLRVCSPHFGNHCSKHPGTVPPFI